MKRPGPAACGWFGTVITGPVRPPDNKALEYLVGVGGNKKNPDLVTQIGAFQIDAWQ